MDMLCELSKYQCLYSHGFDSIYGKNEHENNPIHEPYMMKKERFVHHHHHHHHHHHLSENMKHHHHDRVISSPESWMILKYMFSNSSNCQNPPILTTTFLTIVDSRIRKTKSPETTRRIHC
jgi:hypothetical protein